MCIKLSTIISKSCKCSPGSPHFICKAGICRRRWKQEQVTAHLSFLASQQKRERFPVSPCLYPVSTQLSHFLLSVQTSRPLWLTSGHLCPVISKQALLEREQEITRVVSAAQAEVRRIRSQHGRSMVWLSRHKYHGWSMGGKNTQFCHGPSEAERPAAFPHGEQERHEHETKSLRLRG